MSYKLEKPYTDSEYANFIVNYNHLRGLEICSTDTAVYALEKNEIMQDDVPVIDTEYQNKLIDKRRTEFEKQFFNTSLGWIRRNVQMKDGSKKDFLSDLLLPIKAGMELGQEVQIITYLHPDFEIELTNEYMESLQVRKIATPEFILECLEQTVNDFEREDV